MTLEEEIVLLTNQWINSISGDHHKDRDCHWYVTKTYSYGEEPYYQASHHGYVINPWVSPKVETEEFAMTLLRDKLIKELNEI